MASSAEYPVIVVNAGFTQRIAPPVSVTTTPSLMLLTINSSMGKWKSEFILFSLSLMMNPASFFNQPQKGIQGLCICNVFDG